MLRQIDMLEAGLYSGMLDQKKTLVQLAELKRIAGLMRPMDREFAEYFKGYRRVLGDPSVSRRLDQLLSDTEMTVGDSVQLKLRRKLKEALHRLHGTAPLPPSVPQTDVERLIRQYAGRV